MQLVWTALSWLLLFGATVQAFYFPGVNPYNFAIGDK